MRAGWMVVSLCLACSTSSPAAEGAGSSAPSTQAPLSPGELAVEQKPNGGELTYRRYCIGCHGDDGRGNGGVTGADLTVAGGPLETKGDEALMASIRDGKTGKFASMPAHRPILSDAQVAEVLAYVRSRYGDQKR